MDAKTRNVIQILILASTLQACVAIQDFLAPLGDKPVVESAPPIVERPVLEPISRNYFVLESADQTVVGEPQLVLASNENTFSLLAREYGLGYDEILVAVELPRLSDAAKWGYYKVNRKPGEFADGFGWSTVAGILFCGLAGADEER